MHTMMNLVLACAYARLPGFERTVDQEPEVKPARFALRTRMTETKEGASVASTVASYLGDHRVPCTKDRGELFVVETAELPSARYCIPHTHRMLPSASLIESNRTWEPETHRLIRTRLQDVPGSAITAGLSYGDYLPLLSKELSDVSHKLRIFGFEPSGQYFRAAAATASENAALNVRLYNAGLASQAGKIDFCTKQLGVELGGATHVVQTAHDRQICDTIETVPVLTLDSVVPPDQRISVLHLDVEGMEADVLRGASRILSDWKPLVVVETKTNVLDPFGYMLVHSLENNHVYET